MKSSRGPARRHAEPRAQRAPLVGGRAGGRPRYRRRSPPAAAATRKRTKLREIRAHRLAFEHHPVGAAQHPARPAAGSPCACSRARSGLRYGTSPTCCVTTTGAGALARRGEGDQVRQIQAVVQVHDVRGAAGAREAPAARPATRADRESRGGARLCSSSPPATGRSPGDAAGAGSQSLACQSMRATPAAASRWRAVRRRARRRRGAPGIVGDQDDASGPAPAPLSAPRVATRRSGAVLRRAVFVALHPRCRPASVASSTLAGTSRLRVAV